MQTVPSLIGTGTAIAAAATGLVFGQPVEPSTIVRRPSQLRRKISFDRDLPSHGPLSGLTISRADTDSEAPSTQTDASQHNTLSSPPIVSRPPLSRYQRPSTSYLTSPKPIGRRRSLLKQRDTSASRAGDGPRDSISSNGSWVRRLSIRRPLSQHGSVRSSVGPDSPSIAYSYTSSAPILSRPNTAAQHLPPNKLVKRSPSMQNNDSTTVTHSRSKSHLPTLRRPATSHQRSATLQQQFRTEPVTITDRSPSPAYYTVHERGIHGDSREPSPIEKSRGSRKIAGWISFFHSRTGNIGGAGKPSLGEGLPRSRSVSGKRIAVSVERQRVHLVKPRMVSASSAPAAVSFPMEPQAELLIEPQIEPPQVMQDEMAVDTYSRAGSPETRPTGRAKRSFSMPFSSTGNWISRTSGSLRRPKRGAAEEGANNKRHVSAPSTGAQIAVDLDLDSNAPLQPPFPPNAPLQQGPALDSAASVHHLPTHKRNLSSPLPPLAGSSSFHVDLPRLGSPGGAAIHPTRQNQPSGSSTSSAAMSQLRASSPQERSSLIEGSESDARGFISGDDDDTDFKSDNMFDSLRTAASSRGRHVESPDESPPSTASNGKTKRLSIQEILGSTWDGSKIMEEEDENATTPVRGSGDAETDYRSHHPLAIPRLSTDSSHNGVSLSPRDLARLSLDDDFEEEDWTGDDDAPFNALSPPSKNSSLNSRGMNPNVRLALANLSINQMADADHNDTRNERPLGNLFDWSESSVYGKNDADGISSRPKTAYGKQELDSRGGRSVVRKGPAPAHIRSQSVPVVHDADEVKPSGSKYGTWGLGTKPVSEDWDEDFEFGAGINEADDESNPDNIIAVPESIRASQPSVKAHSGQIRELSLLVNDLKRLCRHGRHMDMLDGQQRALWKEAEGVIALASPDEDADDENDEPEYSTNPDALRNKDLFDDGFDASSLGKFDAAFDNQEPAMSKTAVVRERHSPKRRSVFSPDDDIFGGNWPLTDEKDIIHSNFSSRPRTPENRSPKPQDPTVVARSAVQVVQRSILGQPRHVQYDYKMHFDTNSLKVLVRRAGELRDTLSDVIRRAEQITQSPAKSPRPERHAESSPAFTRVFDDPGSSPPRRTIISRGGNPIIDPTSAENSPSSGMNRRLQPMTVS